MNIILLAEVSSERVIGGAERMLRGQATGLHRAGHRVSIVVRAPTEESAPEVLVDGVREFRYPVNRRSGVSFLISSLIGSLSVYDRVRRTDPPDAVIIHQSPAGLGPVCFRKRSAKRWVYFCLSHAHEEYLTRNEASTPIARIALNVNAAVRRLIEYLVIRRCDRVAVMSRFMRDRVTRFHSVPESTISIIEGAVDLERFRPAPDRRRVRSDLGLQEQGILIFTVRNLVQRMGLENLIDAMAQLRETESHVHLYIGGEGPLRQALQDRIAVRGLQDRVHLAGFIAEELLPRYFQAADCVVMPTARLEGFGLVTIEAMACGTPVVGTPVGAIPEVLTRVDPRLVTDAGDSAAIAAGLRRIIGLMRRDPEEWRRLGRKCSELVNSVYTWEQHCRRLLEVIAVQDGGAAP